MPLEQPHCSCNETIRQEIGCLPGSGRRWWSPNILHLDSSATWVAFPVAHPSNARRGATLISGGGLAHLNGGSNSWLFSDELPVHGGGSRGGARDRVCYEPRDDGARPKRMVLLLAGGAESEALDFLADSGSTGARYMIAPRPTIASRPRRCRAAPATISRCRTISICCAAAWSDWLARRRAGSRPGASPTRSAGRPGSRPSSDPVPHCGRRWIKRRGSGASRPHGADRRRDGHRQELLARALHYGSPCAGDPFVEVNCAAIRQPAERSSGTSVAPSPARWRPSRASSRSPMGARSFSTRSGPCRWSCTKLLRALETRSIRRVGGQQSRQMDVRVVAASHVDLGQAVRQREFREDLYYRLNVVTLVLPPLRGREATSSCWPAPSWSGSRPPMGCRSRY